MAGWFYERILQYFVVRMGLHKKFCDFAHTVGENKFVATTSHEIFQTIHKFFVVCTCLAKVRFATWSVCFIYFQHVQFKFKSPADTAYPTTELHTNLHEHHVVFSWHRPPTTPQDSSEVPEMSNCQRPSTTFVHYLQKEMSLWFCAYLHTPLQTSHKSANPLNCLHKSGNTPTPPTPTPRLNYEQSQSAGNVRLSNTFFNLVHYP